MRTISTPLNALLGLRVPIIQAPMAGGPSTPELVAAVSGAGALGSLAFAYTQPEDMRRAAVAVRARTDRPFAINLFVAPQPHPIAAEVQRPAIAAITAWHAELGLPAPEPVSAPYAPDFRAQLDAAAEIRPAVFNVHLGAMPEDVLRAFKAAGMKLGGSATCIAEAQRLEALGYDYVIAQGAEAGGHRGSFLRDPYDALTGTLALVRLIVRAVRIPVVASGGIMDGSGVAAALALGAAGAQLGTAFVPCPESGASSVHKEAILAAREDDTRITEKFSGKPARSLSNRFIREAEARQIPQLAFPAQNMLTGKLRAASAKAGKADFVPLWSGQAAPLARALPAAELVARLEAETLEAIDRLAGLVR
jgi:nitronate monooxygenase